MQTARSAVVIVCLLAFHLTHSGSPSLAAEKSTISVANAPFVDASMTYLGETEGIFSRHGLDVRIIDATWADQFDLIASGSADIALASLDQVVARAKNLDTLGVPIVFTLPAWQFVGLGYYTKGEYQTLDYFLERNPETAYTDFLSQFRNKKIALTEGTVFEQGFISLVEKSALKMSDFSIVNTSPSAGLNGLEDPAVGLAAVGYQQWAEAERRGYKRAVSAKDVDVVVITGFMTSAAFAKENSEEVMRFGCAWFEIAKLFASNPRKAYDVIEPRLEARGATPISFEEFQSISVANVIPLTPTASTLLFLQPSSPAYWHKAWDQAAKNLADTDKGEAIPSSTKAFQAVEVLERMQLSRCESLN